MFKLSKKTHYGLIALKHLSSKNKGEVSSAKEISNTYNISQSLLAKILQKLAQSGILDSISGVNGGYFIAKNPSLISIIDIIEAIDGKKNPFICKINEKICAQSFKCEIKEPVVWLSKKIYEILKNTKISEFFLEGEEK